MSEENKLLFGKESGFSQGYAKSKAFKYKNFDLPSPRFYSDYFAFKLLQYLNLPFTEFDAYKEGLIDDTGKELKKAETKQEKEVYNYYTKLIIKLRNELLKTVPQAKLNLIIRKMFLVRENNEDDRYDALNATLEAFEALNNDNVDNVVKDLFEASMSGGMATGGGFKDIDYDDYMDSIEYYTGKKKKKKLFGGCTHIDKAPIKESIFDHINYLIKISKLYDENEVNYQAAICENSSYIYKSKHGYLCVDEEIHTSLKKSRYFKKIEKTY